MVMLKADNNGGFQTFEFCFGNFKFFWVKAAGFFKNRGVSACVYVVLHSMGRIRHHITCAECRWKFLKLKFDICMHRIRNGLNIKGWVYYELVTRLLK